MIDLTCDRLAKFLQNWLNEKLDQTEPGSIACRDTICYDAINPDLSRFPLLKVYRLFDSFEYGRPKSQTQFVITYCLTFPNQDKLPGMLRWVAFEINEALTYWKHNSQCPPIIQQGRLRAEYRIMVNEVSQPVYAFLRFSFTGIDYIGDN